MTRVFYECHDKEGNKIITVSYTEAKTYEDYTIRYEPILSENLNEAMKDLTK